MWKCIYPNIESDGLSLFKAQVQFRGVVWSLCLLSKFSFLFHPPDMKER